MTCYRRDAVARVRTFEQFKLHVIRQIQDSFTFSRFFWLREMVTSFLKERLERQKMDWKRDVGTFIFRKEQNNRS